MGRGECVIGWIDDESSTGRKGLAPVTCKQLISAYESTIYKLSTGEELSFDELIIVAEIKKRYLEITS